MYILASYPRGFEVLMPTGLLILDSFFCIKP